MTGKSYQESLSLIDLFQMFPDNISAMQWFESVVWPGTRACGHCGSTHTKETRSHRTMPYWCPACRSFFSVKTGTAMARSKISYRKWAVAIYLCLTSPKGISSMQLHRDLGITQKSTWFMLHRIREAWTQETPVNFSGPVEADETYFGGKEMNKHAHKKLHPGGGSVGKMVAVGLYDRKTRQVRAQVVRNADGPTLQGLVREHTRPGTMLYTDDNPAYRGARNNHAVVRHSTREYVIDATHTNSIESFWATLKRAHKGTYHQISPKHLNRYVQEFAARHNLRDSGTLAQMRATVAGMVGRNLFYRDLTRDSGSDASTRA